MTVRLLDVNVLIALTWPAHESHSLVQNWFSASGARAWATCPFTQAAFVRIVSNPIFSPDAVTPNEAIEILAANMKHKGHHFWSDHVDFPSAVEHFRKNLTGHRQVTDAYLLGLAVKNNGRLATLDRAIDSFLGETEVVEVIA
jgi:toxin-antitoxin system PIN domain toxin